MRRLAAPKDHSRGSFHRKEWLLTNGLGGYASGTIGGDVTRRYHGLLVAALPAPLGRVLMLNHLGEIVRLPDGERLPLSGDDSTLLAEVRFEYQLPVWRFVHEKFVLEKRLLLINGQNTIHISYRLLEGSVELELHPSFQFRPHEVDVGVPVGIYQFKADGSDFEILAGAPYPPVRITLDGNKYEFRYNGGQAREIFYQHEAERGYQSRGQLWTPGYFLVSLQTGSATTLIGSTERWDIIHALRPASAYEFEIERRRHLLDVAGSEDSLDAELVLAADQFIVSPVGRIEDSARARATGDEIRTVIAGYHWFTDWGRDTMISLEGLTLSTGRYNEAGWILRMFAHHVRDGLIPNLFPEGKNAGLYHTADATLWFFHAIDRYVTITGDQSFLKRTLPILQSIISAHERGTHFGIGMDPEDALIRQGEEGYQLTWMDAKVEDWVVTPRRGKAVEINALWYNALRLMQRWLGEERNNQESERLGSLGDRVRDSFSRRFWNPATGYLFDVLDGPEGNDAACRPNQIFSISLPHAVLSEDRWGAVLDVVQSRLLTPVGLRSLSADHHDYKARYFGDLRARDAAYHQGTVWGWLIGPFIDAWIKVRPDESPEGLLNGLTDHLGDAGVSSISEIFDAEEPFTPRGCIAQAWSVAETLRCRRKIAQLHPEKCLA